MTAVLYNALGANSRGLAAQSQKLGAISDNIANINTVGYKRAEVQFSTRVSSSISSSLLTPGGVDARPRQVVDGQGVLQGTNFTTDLAIQGGGFFLTSAESQSGANTADALTLTRAGSFRIDENGDLKNSAGLFLQGWPVNRDGQIARDGLVLPATVDNLETVSVNRFSALAEQTENVRLKANIPSNTAVPAADNFANFATNAGGRAAADTNGDGNNDLIVAGPPAGTRTGDYTQRFTTYDAHGVARNVEVAWTRINDGNGEANLWAMEITNITNADGTAALDAGTEFNFTAAANTANTDAAAADTVVASRIAFVRFDGNGAMKDIHIPTNGFDGTTDFTTARAANQLLEARAREGNPSSPADVLGISVGNLPGAAGEIHFEVPTTAAGADDLSTMLQARDVHPTPATNGSPFGLNGAQGLQFNFQLGRPTDLKPVGGGTVPNEYSGTGKDGVQSIASKPGSPVEITTTFLNQDGFAYSPLQGVKVDDDGLVRAVFANGEDRAIYRIPIGTVANPNGLENMSGNAYRKTKQSGEILLQRAGDGGAGKVVGSSLEASNVDLSQEFSEMIVTQQGYTANTRAISTTQQLMTDLVNMVR